jgi:uncharacterized low-complexity protein
MEKKKSILAGSLLTGAIIAVSSFSANAAGMFNYNNLGTGHEVRTNLLRRENSSKNFELKCGEKGKTDSTMAKKGKDGKCGEGKCGDNKKPMKKGKDGKCGANKKSM